MKKIIQVLFFAFFTISLTQAQTTIKPIWTTGHVGNGAVYSPDNSKILTWSGGGLSLWKAENGEHLFTVTGHPPQIFYARFSRDGKKIFTAGGGELVVWSADTGKEEFRGIFEDTQSGALIDVKIDDNFESLVCIGFSHYLTYNMVSGKILYRKNSFGMKKLRISPDGLSFIVIYSNSLGVHDVTTGELLVKIVAGDKEIRSAVYDKNGKYILTSSEDDSAHIWDVSTGKSVASYFHGEDINNAQFTDDGSKIITFSDYDVLKVWNVSDGKLLFSRNSETSVIRNAFLSPKGDMVVTNHYADSVLIVWDVTSGDTLHVFKDPLVLKKDLVFNSTQDRLLLLGDDCSIKVCDLQQDFKTLFTIRGHDGARKAEFHPTDKNVLLTTNPNGFINVWSLNSKFPIRSVPLKAMYRQFVGPYFDRIGNFLLYISEKYKKAVLWDMQTNSLDKVFNHTFNNYYTSSICLSHDNELVALGTQNVGIYSVKTGDTVSMFPTPLYPHQFNKDGTQLLCQDYPYNRPALLDVKSGKTSVLTKTFSKVVDVEYRSGDNSVVAFVRDGVPEEKEYARAWNATTGEQIHEIMTDRYDEVGQINKSGNLVLSFNDNVLKVWDFEAGEKIMELKNDDTRDFKIVAFLDNERFLLTNRLNEGDIEVWDIEKGKVIRKLIGHTGQITHMVVHPDEMTLLTSSEDGAVKVWDMSEVLAEVEENEDRYNPLLTLSPNPTVNNISALIYSRSEVTFSIINQFGEKVLAGLLPGSVNSHTIETSVLPSGMYLFVYDINGKTHQQKFIVNK